MTDSPHARKKIAAFWGVVSLSAVTMLYLFWRFPLQTALVTVGVLALVFIWARLARSIDFGDIAEMDRHSQLQ
jgi:hypothetical protein